MFSKQNRNGYNFFSSEQYKQLKALRLGKDREITKMIGDSWNNLKEEEKSMFSKRKVWKEESLVVGLFHMLL